MNILHLYKTYLNHTFGGIEKAISQIATTNNKAFTHTVLSLSENINKAQIVYHCGVKNICYKEDMLVASNGMSFSLFCDFGKIAKQADVIHYHFPWPFADMLHLFGALKNRQLSHIIPILSAKKN